MTLKNVMTSGSIMLFGVAAFLWFYSTRVKVSAEKVLADYQKIHGPHSGPAQIVGDDGSDFYATVQLQTKWNRSAAIATAFALGLQAVATAL